MRPADVSPCPGYCSTYLNCGGLVVPLKHEIRIGSIAVPELAKIRAGGMSVVEDGCGMVILDERTFEQRQTGVCRLGYRLGVCHGCCWRKKDTCRASYCAREKVNLLGEMEEQRGRSGLEDVGQLLCSRRVSLKRGAGHIGALSSITKPLPDRHGGRNGHGVKRPILMMTICWKTE